MDAEVELLAGGLGGFRLKSSSSLAWTELRCHSSQESQDWVEKIKEVSTSAVLRDTESRRRERSLRIALELSSLVTTISVRSLQVRLSDLSDISFISHRRIYRERKY